MKIEATSVPEYISYCPEDRREALRQMRNTIKLHIPKGFEETISYNMPAYVVPHRIYPDGYHCEPAVPLPFTNFASQKNFIALYHMGIYAIPELCEWFKKEYAQQVSTKLDMGKSCIRFKKVDQIPFDLIGKLMSKVTVQQWIDVYESNYKK